MKLFRRVFAIAAILVLGISLAACGGGKEGVQGVTKDEILIGNTATTSGPAAVVGVPFNQAIMAVIERYNNLPEEQRYAGGRKLRFVTYDDGFTADKGKTLTEKLIEEDKIFALVGHFGTPTVGATIGAIKEKKIPMVYAATGINDLYTQKEVGCPVLPVQPIYKTDGRIMAARLLYEALHGELNDKHVGEKLAADAKVGVLYTGDDAGKGILEGVKLEFEFAKKSDKLVEQQFDPTNQSTVSAAAQKMKEEGVKAIIIASNQNPFKIMSTALAEAGSTAAVFTSYVNADPTAFDTKVVYNFNIFTNSWVDILSDSAQESVNDFVDAITKYSKIDEATKKNLYTNAFATAGYIAIQVFLEGLKNLGEEELTWENYIKALESKKIKIPMGTEVDFTGGKRWGIANMSLLVFKGIQELSEPKAGAKPVYKVGTDGKPVLDADGNPVIDHYVYAGFDAARPFEALEDIEKK